MLPSEPWLSLFLLVLPSKFFLEVQEIFGLVGVMRFVSDIFFVN